MNQRDLLTHELGPFIWSFALSDDSLAKANKAVQPKLLEDGAECLPSSPDQTTAAIIDTTSSLEALV